MKNASVQRTPALHDVAAPPSRVPCASSALLLWFSMLDVCGTASNMKTHPRWVVSMPDVYEDPIRTVSMNLRSQK